MALKWYTFHKCISVYTASEEAIFDQHFLQLPEVLTLFILVKTFNGVAC